MTTALPRLLARLPVRLLGVLLAPLLLLVLAPVTPAAAADPVEPPSDGPYFGPQLDWTDDSASQYADRLGARPSVYAQQVAYPLAAPDVTVLEQFAQQAAQQGALAELTLEPSVPLEELTAEDAEDLVDTLVDVHEQYDSTVLLRFAPEMNGSWTPWGQEPGAYVDAFREVADVVHASAPDAAMVWAPSYGSGYPFTGSSGRIEGLGDRDLERLDTTGDGLVDAADDPYGPYFPGTDAVDWVGLSIYHYGVRLDTGERDDEDEGLDEETNTVPEPGAYAARLDEAAGYGDDRVRESFYSRFAEALDKPMAVRTGAFYDPDASGDDGPLDIKRTWWRQVIDPDLRSSYPRIALVSWLEVRRAEAETGDSVVDWRVTHTSTLADALLGDLRAADVDLGPVTRVIDQQTSNEASNQYLLDGIDAGDQMGWITALVVLAFVTLLVSGLVGRFVPSWRYPTPDDPRDQRLDLLRGWIIVAVVVTHIEVAGPYSYVARNAIGAITGAELFVLLSGIVLGMVYPVAVRRQGEYVAAVQALLRARKQYLTALVVVVLVFLISLLPFVDASVITTFTDRGTGSGGPEASGQVYDLYVNAPRLFDYPPPWYAVRQLLLLEMGPWVFNIMGLFVVLSLFVPALMWLIQRGYWWAVLLGSAALYGLDRWVGLDLLPSQFDDVFPLAIWQVPFCVGLVVGRYRREITRALTSRAGVVAVTVALGAYAATLGVLWLQHGSAYDWLYPNLYQRTELQGGRLLDLALVIVVAYALLTCVWKPIAGVAGWFLVPLGRVSLYVFIVHVFFVLAVGNVPGLDRTSWWQGFLVHTVVLAIIWVMVRKKFLARVIPA
ncbi:OpgC domain-containing protein [uncultured Nocardioides sp.]|uniref:OpgC domain-containing protein n=1 Tax=uncultured Nocardioides sp. TaxID=198441 RepID=UPI002622A12E|nr:OpgC domain-containing protein [uncultured Nocardioides sp.]